MLHRLLQLLNERGWTGLALSTQSSAINANVRLSDIPTRGLMTGRPTPAVWRGAIVSSLLVAGLVPRCLICHA